MQDFEERQGIISRIINPKGYGFIGTSEKEHYFFHAKTMLSEDDFNIVKPGDLVSFIIVQTAKGPQAMRVKILDFAGDSHAER